MIDSFLTKSDLRIVFPEPDHPEVRKAIEYIANKSIAKPILLFRSDKEKYRLKNTESFTINDFTSLDDWIYSYASMHKQSVEQAKAYLNNPQGVAGLLVKHNIAHTLISLKHFDYESIIGVKRIPSGLVFMQNKDSFFLSDFIHSNPTAQELAEIALETANTLLKLGLDPRVVLVDHPLTSKAIDIINTKGTKLEIKKLPIDAALLQNFNAFVFPSSSHALSVYSFLKHCGYSSSGQIIQGLNKYISIALDKDSIINSAILLVALLKKD